MRCSVRLSSIVADNRPGVVKNFADMGNTVMIRHATGEVSVFGHTRHDHRRAH